MKKDEEYSQYKYSLRFEEYHLKKKNDPKAMLDFNFILKDPPKDVTYDLKKKESIPKLDEGSTIKFSDIFNLKTG